jgi:multiple sugar transport system permease protein
MAAALGALLLLALAWWTWRSVQGDRTDDGRQTIIFWGTRALGDDIYTAIHRFERRFPQYKVIMGTAVARNLTGDAQRLLCAVAGGVPPDVVWHDRFAVGEWAGRSALEDLTSFVQAQRPDDRYRIDLGEYYEWAVREASYAPPGSTQSPRVYGIPTSIDIRVLYSNADLLRQEGLVQERILDGRAVKEPRPPCDWDELRLYANRLTRYADPRDKTRGLARLGFGPNFGNSWLYMYAWQAGGEFMNADRTRITMDSPPVVRALRYMADIYDDIGGFAQAEAFRQSFQGGELDPFLRGQVAMKIDGDWSLATIADWKRDMDFLVTPAPLPPDRIAAGHKPITWAGGWALVIPKTAHNKEGAFKLIQYLRSWEVMDLLEQGKREQKQSEGKLYLPTGNANRKFYEHLIAQHIDAPPESVVPRRFKEAYAVLKAMMPSTLIRPVTPVGQLLWEQHRKGYENAVLHEYADEARRLGVDEMQLCLQKAQEPVQRSLDEILRPLPPEMRVDWTPYFWCYGLLVALPFAAMFLAYHRRRRLHGYKAREVGSAMLFASPWTIGFIIFIGAPILFSIVFSFTSYSVLAPAHYVGLDNYRQVFGDDLFYKSLGNTLFMVLRIPLVMALSLAIALLLNRAIRGMGVYRTAFYMPAIMPMVAASLLWLWIFNPSQGALNQFLNWLFDTPPFEWLESLIGWITSSPVEIRAPLWLNDKAWSKPGLIVMNLWTAGGGMIIWLAGLQSIPPQLYEAASIDGAGAWKRFKHVTLPMLSPYILFNAVVGLIHTMQIFGEAFIMTEGGPADSTLFYAYHLFKEAFQFFRLGTASALAWILFVIVLALTLLQLWLSKRWVHYEQS